MTSPKQSSPVLKSGSSSAMSFSYSNLSSDVLSRWKKRRPLPQARDGHVAVFYGNRINIFCGGDGNKWYTDSWTYDFDHKKWQVHNSTKYPPLWGGTATLLPNNQVFVFGGKDDKGIDQNVAYLFDLDLNTYKRLEMPSEGNVLSPPPRRLHSSNYINGFVYVFAGRQSTQNYHNDLWKLDLTLSKWSQVYFDRKEPAPIARWDHGSAVVGDALYIFGGMDQNNKPLGDFWKFETTTQKWIEMKLAQLPPPGACKLIGPLTIQKANVLVYLNDYLATVWLYDIGMQVWTPIVPTGKGPTWREYYTATIVNNEIYVIGGHERNRVSSEMYQLQWIETVAHLVMKLEKGQQRIEGRIANLEQQLQQMNTEFETEIRSLTKQLNDVLTQNDLLIRSLKKVNELLANQLTVERETNSVSETLITRIQQQRTTKANQRRKAIARNDNKEKKLKSQVSSHSATEKEQHKELKPRSDNSIPGRTTKSATELTSLKSSKLRETNKNITASPVTAKPIERTPEQLLKDLHDFFVLVVELKSKDAALLNAENIEQLNQILFSFPTSCDKMPWKSDKEKQLAILMLEVIAQSQATKGFLFDDSLLKLYSTLLRQVQELKKWDTSSSQ